MSKINFAHNIYLQAKRASKVFDVPLSKAKDLIATVVYQCHDFNELVERFEDNGLKSSVYPFCKIDPKADDNLLVFLDNNIESLAERFTDILIKPYSQMALVKAIRFIFGLKANDVEAEPNLSLPLSQWQVYPRIKGNRDAVYCIDINVNEVPFRVLATSVVTACSFEDNSVNQVQVLHDEFSKYEFAPIMWQDWSHWQEEADIFFNTVGLNDAPRGNAFNNVCQPTNEEQEAYEERLYELLNSISETNFIDTIKTVQLGNLEFYLVGYPISIDCEKDVVRDLYVTDAHIHNNKCIINMGGNIVCLELIEEDGIKDEVHEESKRFGECSTLLEQFVDAEMQPIVVSGTRYFAFLRPSFELEHERYCSSSVSIQYKEVVNN